MASLFRPITVRPIPENAKPVKGSGGKKISWKSRTGEVIIATVTAGGKCRTRSPVWWIEYRNKDGKRCRVSGSRNRAAAEHKMAGIVRDVELMKGGKAPESGAVGTSTILSLASAYRDHLKAVGRVDGHYNTVHRQIVDVATACKWTTPSDVTVAGWERWVGVQRDAGMAADTINHYLRALRALFRWAKAGAPLADAKPLNAEADRRRFRRALSSEDFRKLIDSTRARPGRLKHLTGPDRAALYLFAARTGFRAGLLSKLHKADVRLDDSLPHIPTKAADQKSRKALTIPLSAAFVVELRGWLAARPAGLLWPGGWHDKHRSAAVMLRKDLEAAGIPFKTPDGTYDFHSLRGQCATDLALAGVPLHVTQRFMGHSSPALTARHYLRAGLADLAEAAAKVI